MSKPIHIPVLLNETIDYLDLQPSDIVLDGTFGFGGHSSALYLRLGVKGRLLCLDKDIVALNKGRSFMDVRGQTPIYAQTSFADFDQVLKQHRIKKLDKVLLDLGISSFQLDASGRGFSFQKDEPLDMRMNENSTLTAQQILNSYAKEDLIQIFKNYGEIYRPEKFVDFILSYRQNQPLATTNDLIYCIKKGFFFHNKRFLFIKTMSQVFQALRIEVNNELGDLKTFLDKILDYLAPNGRIAIITFHSLEDRLVKEFGRNNKKKLELVNNKVVKPTQTEIKANLRAKPAKLRVYKKL